MKSSVVKSDNIVSMFQSKMTMVVWSILSLILIFIITGPSIYNDLITDDFWWLWRLSLNNPLIMQPDSGHWSPTVQIVLWALYNVFGIYGAPYHALTVLLIWVNALLVVIVAHKITGSLNIGIISGTGVILNHQAAQIYTWAVGIWYPISNIFFLVGFIGYFISIQSPNKRNKFYGYILFLLGIMLGQLTHEQTWTLVPVAVAHTFFLVDYANKKPFGQWYSFDLLKSRIVFFILPSLMVGGGILLRLVALGDEASQPLASFPFYESWISILRTFIPGLSREMAANLSLGLAGKLGAGVAPQIVVFLLQYTLLIIAFIKSNNIIRFLLIWTALQVILMLFALGFLFPRHYLLATFPSIIMWSYLVVFMFNKCTEVAKRFIPRYALALTVSLSVCLATFIVATQISQHRAFQRSWAIATSASSKSLEEIRRVASERPTARNLVLLNFPDILVSENREWIGIFNAGTAEAVKFYIPDHFTTIEMMKTPVGETPSADSGLPQSVTQPNLPNIYPGVGRDTTFQDVYQLVADPNTLVFQFDTSTMNVFLVESGTKSQLTESDN